MIDTMRTQALDRINCANFLHASAKYFERLDRKTYAPVIALLHAESDTILKLGLYELRNVKSPEE